MIRSLLNQRFLIIFTGFLVLYTIYVVKSRDFQKAYETYRMHLEKMNMELLKKIEKAKAIVVKAEAEEKKVEVVPQFSKKILDNLKCYEDHPLADDLELNRLEDILEADVQPTAGKSIFFIETSCSKDGHLELTSRQACAIESTASENPNSDIFVLFLSPVSLTFPSRNPVVNAIRFHENIHFRNLNLWSFAKGTPTEEWIKSNKIFSSDFLLNHLADFLRYLTLWKYGGTYFDMDIILKRSIEDVPPNYSGAQGDVEVAIEAMNFDHNGIGHEIVEKCLLNLQENFDGTQWSHNGNGVLNRVLQEVCSTSETKEMTEEKCKGFRVYPKETFYAIDWDLYQQFFDENELVNVIRKTNNSIGVHFWNKVSKNEKVKVQAGSNVAYGFYAEEYCANVYRSCGEYF